MLQVMAMEVEVNIPALPIEGGCRCGRMRFRISESPMLTGACHCTGCQRMTGSAFSLTVTVPDAGFKVIRGEPVIGGLHGDVKHFHCAHCMSWIFTRPPEASMAFVNVRATMLDEANWFVPFVESYTSEKLPWAETPAKHSYPKFPPMEDYQGLLEEFATSAAKT